jgi:cell division protein FtsL
MRNIFKSKKICWAIIGIIFIYTLISFIGQEKKLSKYNSQAEYYNTQIESLEEEKAELLQEQENVDSPEYIEEQAREKLDMYYPNERVYIAQ